eukprot:m.920339 g.920339  ORF g.920339 m.920339 type:complete len:594 (-) comp63583_c0_seq1:122-1903(-)
MGRVHVADFEASALAGQTTRAKSGNATLVRDFRQRVGLVHELRQLRRTEELLQRRRDRLGVDQVVRHQGFGLGLAQTLLDGLLDTGEARAVLVFGQFAHAAHATVAQVVDVVHFAAAIAQLDEDLDDVKDVLVGQVHVALGRVTADTRVELHAADTAQVVGVGAVEQAVEQGLDGIFRRRLAGAHHAIDRDAGSQLGLGLVRRQRLRDVGAFVQLVREQALDFLDAGLAQLLQQRVGQFVVGLRNDLAGVGVDHVLGQHAADQEVFRHRDVLRAGLLQLASVTRGDALVLLDDDGTRLVDDVEAGDFTLQAVGYEFELRTNVHQTEVVEHEEVGQDLFRLQADGLQQDGDRHLAAAVDAEVQDVLRVELEVQPGAAVRNDAGAEQQLARAVGLALVVLEEHARRTVQLRHDDALGTVDDETAVVGHQGHFAHVDLLFLDLLDGLRLGRLTVIDDHLQARAHGGCVGQPPLLALTGVERRLGDVELEELHLDKTVVRNNRERREESRLKPFGLAFGGGHVLLQEGHVAVLLHGQQIGNVENALALAEALADPLALGIAVGGCLRHKHSVSSPPLAVGRAASATGWLIRPERANA